MKRENRKILITGGAGYIGQNLVSFFLKKNFKVYVVDNLSTSAPIEKNIKKNIYFHKIDLTNEKKTKIFFYKKKFDLIIHLAAFSGVQEFNRNILKSFNNNVLATKNLVRFAFIKNNTKLIFASSAAVYGKVSKEKINENYSCKPANYYGLSKLACENIINNSFKNKKNNFAILRYFNVVGSIINFKITKKIYSLFDVIRNNIKRKMYKININGNNFNTSDGTPERDFIHISDLADIHAQVFRNLYKNKNIILNCGSGYRYSVLKIIREFEKKIKRKFKLTYKLKNADETQTICADTKLLKKLLNIDIKKNKLNDLIRDYLWLRITKIMDKKDLIIINNEKISEKSNNFYCDNIDLKSIPEDLNESFNVTVIARSSKVEQKRKINISDIEIASNILKFLFNIYKTFRKKNATYLIISITPYTFFSYLLLFFLEKKFMFI